MVFQFVPQAGFTWKVPGFPLVDLVGHLSGCLSVLARHWLWGIYPTFVDWIFPGYQTGSVQATGLSYIAVFTDSPFRRIWVASVVATVLPGHVDPRFSRWSLQ